MKKSKTNKKWYYDRKTGIAVPRVPKYHPGKNNKLSKLEQLVRSSKTKKTIWPF